MAPNTHKSRTTGVNAFERIASHFGWKVPFFHTRDTTVDLCRLILVINTLGHDEGLARATVSQYLSSAKFHYVNIEGVVHGASSVWGDSDKRHPLVKMAVKAIPERLRTPKMLLPLEWFEAGFHNCWTTAEFVAISFILGWLLRVGEACNVQEAHIITWSMLRFYAYRGRKLQLMCMSDLSVIPCDLLELHQESRKHQEHARPMPGRINASRLTDPSRGLSQWCNLCIPTIMQAWAIQCRIHTFTPQELTSTPVLTLPGCSTTISRKDVAEALRRHARARGEDPAAVVPHCLRMTGITALANSEAAHNNTAYLRAVGHKSIEASAPYVRPGPNMARLITDNSRPT